MLRQRIQLALIHLAVAMTLVPINSTLNRVMIKEFAISAALVAVLASLPYIFSPLQVAIGSFSDRHPIFGWRRSPYILAGLLMCVLGVILAPPGVFLLQSQPLLGIVLCGLAFGSWGMGFNFASVSYLALASEISGEKGRSRTVSLMWFVMILGIIITAAVLSRLLETYTHASLELAFVSVALAALAFGLLGLIGLEPKHRTEQHPTEHTARPGWLVLIRHVLGNPPARRFFIYLILMLAAILGQDILLEPYGGEAFGLSVSQTTRITSIWGGCMFITLLAATWLERRMEKRSVARLGALLAIVGFGLIAASGLMGMSSVFYSGVVMLGLGTGFATVSNLSLMLDMTTSEVGLYIGAWGIADALARLMGTVLSGVVRDIVSSASNNALAGYITVFVIQALLLVISLGMLNKIHVQEFQQRAHPVAEHAALLNDLS